MSLAATNIQRQATAIVNLFSVIKTPAYQAILEHVKSVAEAKYSRRVLMAGVGKNANIASKIAETMASLGIPSMPINVSHLGHGDFGYIGHTDLIIHISRSGTTREMLVAIEHIALIRPNVTQILIHCKPTKQQNKYVHWELCAGGVEEGDEHGLAPTTSTTVLLCLLDCLSVEASHAAGFGRLDFLKYHPDGALGDMLKKEQGLSAEPFAEQHREVPTAVQPHITESAPTLPEVPLMPSPESLPDMDVARLAEFLNNQPAQIFNDDGVLQQTVPSAGVARSSLSDVPKTGSLFQSVAQTSSLLADEKTFGGRPEDLADRKIA